MSDKASKIVSDIVKGLEQRIIKIEKELKSQQTLVKKLIICIAELTTIVKTMPEKQIRRSMAFKYPFFTKEFNLDLSALEIEEHKHKTTEMTKELEISELGISESDEFSLSFDTVDCLNSLHTP
jgi:hypothetical protein